MGTNYYLLSPGIITPDRTWLREHYLRQARTDKQEPNGASYYDSFGHAMFMGDFC